MIRFQASALLSSSYLGIGPKSPLNTTQCGKMITKNHPRPSRSTERCVGYFELMGRNYTSSQYVQSTRNAGRKGKEPRVKNKRNRGNDVRAVQSGRNTVEVMGETMQWKHN